MSNREKIKQEIYELSQKISRASSEGFLLETAREIYEKSILLKHSPDAIPPVISKEEEKTVVIAEEHLKAEHQAPKQAAIDLFTSETTKTEVPPPAPLPEKPAAKERKEPKKKVTESVAEKLQHNKITDLKASIGINEKFQFINELFEGNMKEYNVAVDQINSFSSHEEAESYIANLEDVYKWQPDNQIAENFKELVQRRFA